MDMAYTANQELTERSNTTESPYLVDDAMAGLIEIAAAVGANCEPCLRQTIGKLRAAGVPAEYIRAAAEVGEMVKEKPALVMKEAADVLAGTELVQASAPGACPVEEIGDGEELIRALLLGVGAAMGANCERCLNKAVPALLEAGAMEEDIRKAVEIGQLVKDEATAFVRATTAALCS